MKNSLILLFIIFSIVLPVGIHPQLQANLVFAQSDFASINENVDESDISSSSSKSKFKLKDLSDSSNKQSNENVVSVPYDQSSTYSNSTAIATSQSQISAQSSNEVYGDFNGDGFDDLAIGVPGESVPIPAEGQVGNAGAVNVLYGSSSGLSATSPRPDQFWTQETADVNEAAEPNDKFGRALG